MKKTLLKMYVLTLMALIVSMPVFAQQKTLNGSVQDDTGSPLTGATVKVKGTNVATTTATDGSFTLVVPETATTLEVSFIGYQTKDVAITDGNINVQLAASDDQGLDEVVVIGYGTARKKDLTGSMVTIQAKNFNKGLMTAPGGRIWVNLDGEIENKGVEIALTGTIINSTDWTWDLTANATFLKNNVSGLIGYYETGALRGQGFSGVLGQRMVNGQPLNVWYLAEYTGIDPTTGMSMYRGLDGSSSTENDPAINKFYANSPNPTTLLGLSTNVSYKDFTLSANMNGAMGHYLFNNTAATVLGISNLSSRNIGGQFFDTSVKESTSNSAAPSTRFLEKGDYLKLANLTLSYRVGDIGKTFKNFNVSLTGQNLFIITKYTGFDPEVNTDGATNGIPSLGIEYLPYPPSRNILLGVNFSL
jgi:hypothetical protein